MFGVNAQNNLEDRLQFPQINRKQSNKQTTTAAKLPCTRLAHEEAHFLEIPRQSIRQSAKGLKWDGFIPAFSQLHSFPPASQFHF